MPRFCAFAAMESITASTSVFSLLNPGASADQSRNARGSILRAPLWQATAMQPL